jgi:ArsR family transcriptional regulator
MKTLSHNTYHIFFNNLSNPLRIKIVSALKDKNMSVTELSKKIKVEQSKLSHALSKLKECNLVTAENKGKKRIYSLNRKTLLPILNIIDQHSKLNCGGNCLCCTKHKSN